MRLNKSPSSLHARINNSTALTQLPHTHNGRALTHPVHTRNPITFLSLLLSDNRSFQLHGLSLFPLFCRFPCTAIICFNIRVRVMNVNKWRQSHHILWCLSCYRFIPFIRFHFVYHFSTIFLPKFFIFFN